MDLVGAGKIDPKALVGPFTAEVQQSLGEERFVAVAEAMLAGRALPEGADLDQLYDTQLAALGNYLFNNARYAGAATVWGRLVDRDATSAARRRALALGYFAARRFRNAAGQVRESLQRADGWPEKLRFTGSNLRDVFPRESDLREAVAELQAQAAARPDDSDLGLLAAWVDVLSGHVAAGRKRLEALADSDAVARALAERLRADDAVAETVLAPAPAVVREAASELTGLEEPAMTPEERDHLVAVLKTGADSFKDHLRLGDFRFFMGDFARAEEAYRAARSEQLDDPVANFAMTHAAYANGEYAWAVLCMKQGLRLEPEWGLYEFRLQEFYGDADEYRLHLRELERQVELRPDRAGTTFLLGYVYYFSGRYAAAAARFAEVARADPEVPAAETFLRLARLQS
jgi:tetratricopeptide (TPR) repeat protein